VGSADENLPKGHATNSDSKLDGSTKVFGLKLKSAYRLPFSLARTRLGASYHRKHEMRSMDRLPYLDFPKN
jgi:hypothetical protein